MTSYWLSGATIGPTATSSRHSRCLPVDIRRTSATLVSAAIGEGMENGVCPFTNQLLCGETLLPLDELQTRLKETERLMGRCPGERYTIPIDLDILRYDDRMLHPDDWGRPYIRRLLEDL